MPLIKIRPVEEDDDPFAPEHPKKKGRRSASLVRQNDRRSFIGKNHGANEIFEQRAWISTAFSDLPEPDVKPYSPLTRVSIIVGGALGLWAVLIWGARAILKG